MCTACGEHFDETLQNTRAVPWSQQYKYPSIHYLKLLIPFLDKLPVYHRADIYITTTFTPTFTPTDNLEKLINLTFCMSLDCGRKSAYPERTHADMGITCKLYTESPGSSQVSNPGTSATVWNKTTKGNITSIEVWKRIYIFENDRCFFWVKHYILLLMWLLWTSSAAV